MKNIVDREERLPCVLLCPGCANLSRMERVLNGGVVLPDEARFGVAERSEQFWIAAYVCAKCSRKWTAIIFTGAPEETGPGMRMLLAALNGQRISRSDADRLIAAVRSQEEPKCPPA